MVIRNLRRRNGKASLGDFIKYLSLSLLLIFGLVPLLSCGGGGGGGGTTEGGTPGGGGEAPPSPSPNAQLQGDYFFTFYG